MNQNTFTLSEESTKKLNQIAEAWNHKASLVTAKISYDTFDVLFHLIKQEHEKLKLTE